MVQRVSAIRSSRNGAHLDRALLHSGSMGRDRPQSTDVQDTTGYHGPHTKVSQDERGPDAENDPGPQKSTKDAHVRILGISVHGSKTRVALGSGPNQGIFAGMPGYIVDVTGHIHKFVIADAEGSLTYAYIDAIPDQLHGNVTAVLNPETMPADKVAKKDQEARVLGVSVDGLGTRVLIGFGPEHGATMGMKGFLVNESGYHIAEFSIDELRDGFSATHVQVPHEQVYGAKVILNPS